jgi:uncharacterized membrane protein YfcA
VILLPVFGLVVGVAIRQVAALILTLAAALIGFVLVAIFTDEIDGWSDPFVWGDTAVAVVTTLLGIWIGRWFLARRATRSPRL